MPFLQLVSIFAARKLPPAYLHTQYTMLSRLSLCRRLPGRAGVNLSYCWAQYHWVAGLSPPVTRKTASWFTGWISIGAGICGTASAAYLAGLQIRGLISLCDDSYIPQAWHGVLLYFAVLAYSLAINIWGSGPLSTMNLIAGVLIASCDPHCR